MQKDNSFLKASAVLAASSMLVKILSAAYRIPLTRMLGAYAMGKYSTVFNLFMPFFALATAGITPAVSRLTAQFAAQDNAAGIPKIKEKALFLYIGFATVMTAAFVATGAIYSKNLGETIIFTGAVILAPNIIFASIEAVYKGVTQGEMDMMPTAKANVIESVCKTVLGLGSVYYIIHMVGKYPKDMPIKVSLAAITVSGLVCWVYLVLIYRGRDGEFKNTRGYQRQNPQNLQKAKEVSPQNYTQKRLIKASTLLKMSVPISMSALTVSLVNFFDTAVCLPIIQNIPAQSLVQSFGGASFKGAGEIAMFLFGTYQGMVLTIFNLIPALLASIGTACLPVITRAQEAKDKKALQRQAKRLFCITSVLSTPMCAYVYFFAGDMISALFGTNGAQTVIAQELMTILIPCGIFASFTFALNAILHAYGKSDQVFKILLIASCTKCILSWQLCSIAKINIRGLAISTVVFYVIIFILSTIRVKKLGVEFAIFKTFFVPVTGAYVVSAITMMLAKSILFSLPNLIKLVMTGGIFSLMYFLLLILSGFLVDI